MTCFPERKGHREFRGLEALIEQHAGLRSADEQEAAGGEQLDQRPDRPLLGERIEIDQKIAAEDHVVGPTVGDKRGSQQIALTEDDLLPHDVGELMPLGHRLKKPITKGLVGAAKGDSVRRRRVAQLPAHAR